MAVVTIDGWYDYNNDEYDLRVTVKNEEYDTPEELEEALTNDECSNMFTYDFNTGSHLNTNYVLKVEKWNELTDEYEEIPEYSWDFYL